MREIPYPRGDGWTAVVAQPIASVDGTQILGAVGVR